jgi:hypothetical protein
MIILPEWYAVLDRMATASKSKGNTPLSKRIMPRDVATHWNYTYEMLNFAYIYRDAYNELCANHDMKMRKYEVEDREWEIVKQLADILKVNHVLFKSDVIF